MHPQLEQVVGGLEEARQRLHRLATALPAERWNQRSAPERWSVGECVAHLNLTSRAYLPPLEQGLERAAPEPAARRFRTGALGWLLLRMTGPMPRAGRWRLGRTRTAPAFHPGDNAPRDETLAEFDRLQDRLLELTRSGDGLALDRITIASPFDPRIRYNLYAALAILPGHQHRHLEQAELVWPQLAL